MSLLSLPQNLSVVTRDDLAQLVGVTNKMDQINVRVGNAFQASVWRRPDVFRRAKGLRKETVKY